MANKSPLLAAAYFAPWAVGGLVFATFSGLMLHIVPGLWLLIISGVSKAAALLLFALMPEKPNYWQWVFPAMVFETACVDVLWTVSNVYLTTSLPRQRQGLAGALINVTLFLGSAFFVAIADIAAAELQKTEMSLKDQYQSIFWLGFAVACVALVVCLFIRLGRASSRLTAEEEAELSGKPSSESVQTLTSSATLCNDSFSKHGTGLRTDSGSGFVVALGQGCDDTTDVAEDNQAQGPVLTWHATAMDETEKMANVIDCEALKDYMYAEDDGSSEEKNGAI